MMRLSSDRGLLSWIGSSIRQGVGFCTLVPGFDLGETGRGPGDVGRQPLLATEASCDEQAECKKSRQSPKAGGCFKVDSRGF